MLAVGDTGKVGQRAAAAAQQQGCDWRGHPQATVP